MVHPVPGSILGKRKVLEVGPGDTFVKMQKATLTCGCNKPADDINGHPQLHD
jgi:hypothetical protein